MPRYYIKYKGKYSTKGFYCFVNVVVYLVTCSSYVNIRLPYVYSAVRARVVILILTLTRYRNLIKNFFITDGLKQAILCIVYLFVYTRPTFFISTGKVLPGNGCV